MADRDRFELDLAAALRAYLGDAPTEVRPTELAHQFATTYPHGRTALARWGFGRTRAMAWVLLLAGLLLALVVGSLAVGAWRRDLAVVIAPSPTPTASAVPSVLASSSPSPSRPGSSTPHADLPVLLSLKGNGIKNSKPFTASGDSLDLAYTFDCKAFGDAGNFAVTLYDQSGLALLAVNELAKSGKDTQTVYLANTTAPFHIEINSECAWTVTVTGQP